MVPIIRYAQVKAFKGGSLMQTVYYTTRNFIRSTGNVVDLAEYRRKLAQAEGSLAPAPRHTQAPAARPFPHLVENAPAESPKKARSLPRLSLDSLASIGVLLMTLTFTLRILVF